MNMFPDNPGPMAPPEPLDELGAQELNPEPDIVPMEPPEVMGGGLEDRLEIQEAVEALRPGEHDPAMAQIWEAATEPAASAEPAAYEMPAQLRYGEPAQEVHDGPAAPQGYGLNEYGEVGEHWEFPDGVRATTSSRETVVHDPHNDLTVTAKEPFGDMFILTPEFRRQVTPPVPDRLLSDEALRKKYGEELTDLHLARIRELDSRAKAEEIQTILGRARQMPRRIP